MTIIEQIKAEIEKLIERYGSVKAKGTLQEGYKGGRLIGYEDTLNVLKRIQDNLEKPMNPDAELEKEIERVVSEYSDKVQGTRVMKPSGVEKIARHFAKWGAEHLKK